MDRGSLLACLIAACEPVDAWLPDPNGKRQTGALFLGRTIYRTDNRSETGVRNDVISLCDLGVYGKGSSPDVTISSAENTGEFFPPVDIRFQVLIR